jgi:hypothetical protein
MNLSDFQEYIPHTIYLRGQEYYDMDLIDKVEHEYPDNWSADRTMEELEKVSCHW